MLSAIRTRFNRELNQNQQDVISFGNGPLWVIAGPGSGKTEVLVLRCLKLICIDRIPPKSIIITTFTEKAAKNIQDRIANYKNYLDQIDNSLREIDVFQLRLGTLHSLCNDIMQEYRYTGYQNYRLLDEIDQLLFIYEHSALATSNPDPNTYRSFWQNFEYLVNRYNPITGTIWTSRNPYLPHRWLRVNATAQLFNRIAEDRLDVNLIRNQDNIYQLLATAYEAYISELELHSSCDFARLQVKFLDFLLSPNGRRFLNGDSSLENPGIRHVLVDEYQDTNPIQEEIYLKLAGNIPHNLCVVGDDDQALYRFRGGTVECMVNFDQACQRAWGTSVQVTAVPLSVNYRSNPDIVSWCNDYILSFPQMNTAGARVANKPTLSPDPNWSSTRQSRGLVVGSYPSKCFMLESSENALANVFANTVKGLLDNGIIQDPNQCVLLMRSTRTRSAATYQEALRNVGISVYNPRARTFLEQEEIQGVLGALISILDSDKRALSATRSSPIKNIINRWLSQYDQIATQYSQLKNYVTQSISRIRATGAASNVTQYTTQDTNLPATIQEIFYHIISFEPFFLWQQDPEKTIRLGKLSKVLESYCALPFPGSSGSKRGVLRTETAGQIKPTQLQHFYNSLIGLLLSEGLNEPENEEIVCPSGFFPIMTVHQAKGLEFPFVFVSNVGILNPEPRPELKLEDAFRQYRTSIIPLVFTQNDRALHDYLRFFYVAYSRTEYALVLLCTTREYQRQGIGFGGYTRQWFEQRFRRLL